jgi:hypothetical protein
MTQRKSLTDSNVADLEVREKKYKVLDTKLPGLLVRVVGSGRKTFYFVYSVRDCPEAVRLAPYSGSAAASVMPGSVHTSGERMKCGLDEATATTIDDQLPSAKVNAVTITRYQLRSGHG